MSLENKYQGIVLKKQPLNEADEIISLFTREVGKLRVVAKSSKLSKSKLQHALQHLFVVQITTAGRRSRDLPKIIRAEVMKSFSNIRQNLLAAKTAFYFLELTLKFTPDEQKSLPLFNLLLKALAFVNSHAKDSLLLEVGLAKFKMDFLKVLGLSIHYQKGLGFNTQVQFSNNGGGFLASVKPDAVRVSKECFREFLQLEGLDLDELGEIKALLALEELQKILTSFLEYQLEREIKTEKFLAV